MSGGGIERERKGAREGENVKGGSTGYIHKPTIHKPALALETGITNDK